MKVSIGVLTPMPPSGLVASADGCSDRLPWIAPKHHHLITSLVSGSRACRRSAGDSARRANVVP